MAQRLTTYDKGTKPTLYSQYQRQRQHTLQYPLWMGVLNRLTSKSPIFWCQTIYRNLTVKLH